MALVNRVDKRVRMDKQGIVKYQLLTHCFLNGIQISDSDLECLTALGIAGERELTEFCSYVAEQNIFKTPQSARNAITKAEKKRLLVKIGKNRKTIRLNDDIKLQTEGTVLLDYKFVSVESQEIQGDN
jgi:hypothetical protein